jgi:hypothetical protein
MALLGVQLGPQAAQVLRILALLVALAGGLLALPLLVVQAPAVELAVAFCSLRGEMLDDGWAYSRMCRRRKTGTGVSGRLSGRGSIPMYSFWGCSRCG